MSPFAPYRPPGSKPERPTGRGPEVAPTGAPTLADVDDADDDELEASEVVDGADEPALLDVALAIAASGLPVFPCSPNKRPAISEADGGRGFHDAVTDPDEVRALFARAPHAALIGVPTGERSGVDILDIDPRHNGDQWEAQHLDQLPDTRIHQTPGGGRHHVFQHAPGVVNRQKCPVLGVDVRGQGGYACWPPSGGYAVINEADIAPWPEWLLELVRKPPEAPPRPVVASDPGQITDKRLSGLVASLLARVSRAPEGLKHETLLHIARTIGGYSRLLPNTEQQLIGMLLAALPPTVNDWKNAEQTALDGFRHGAMAPLVLEERQRPNSAPHLQPYAASGTNGADAAEAEDPSVDVDDKVRSQAEAESEPEPSDPLRGAVLPPELHGCPLTEDGVATAYAIEHGNSLRYCHGPNRWHLWDGSRWKVEQTRLAFSWVRDLARRMARGTASKSLRATLGKASFAAGVERMASTDRTFSVTPALWDRDPGLLGTSSGTVDLRTGELRPASREDYITKQTLVTPAENGAEFPIWSQFLDEITLGDRKFRRFLQQIAGYCLTGDVREECLFFLFGTGSNGKGTLLRTVANVMGDYAVAADMATFTASSYDRHPADLAKLAGARLVTATETERDRTWAWSRIKELTGNERPISARFMRENFFEFWVTFKLLFAGNHKPHLPSTDAATARRVNLLPCRFRALTLDDTLKERLIPEYPAILRWAIDGCLDWQANGLLRPEVVLDATKEYLEEQDLFTQWIEAECTTELNDAATHKALFGAWSRFAISGGMTAGSSVGFNERMRAAGFKPIRHTPLANNQRGWTGIALRGAEPPDDDRPHWNRD